MAREQPHYEMHVISNTHWDREWRNPFQQNRMMLVAVMDALLRILDKHPEYACYHLDAQTIVLEDYLEIRPENEEKVRRYIREKRIWAGPWYTCPDMNVLSGESIVRNLLLGHKIARAFGGTMKVGYTPFSFGHIAQLPQIYAGFGIDVILFYRGVGRDRAKAEFWWEAPDGTRALTSQFSRRGRYNFYFHVYRPTVDGRPPHVRDMVWAEIGCPVHPCDPDNQYESIYAMDHPTLFLKEAIGPGIRALKEEDEKEFTTRHLLLMQGCDTTAPNPDEPRIIAEADRCLEEGRVFHSSLPAYARALKKAVGDLPVLCGEMRVPAKHPGPSEVLGDTISCRIYLKQANAASQMQMEKWAEPASVVAWQFGAEYPARYLEIAWKLLLANHAHDSIAGCGVDELHDEMMHRFRQVQIIAKDLARQAVSEVVKRIDGRALPPDGSLVTIWNSLPSPRSEVTTIHIDFDQASVPASFALRDPEGKEVPIQVESAEEALNTIQLRADWPQILRSRRFKVHVWAGDLPAMGYKAYVVERRDTRHREERSQVVGANTMENEHLRVSINPNGTLRVVHKATGRAYDGGHYFEDSGAAGTPWRRIPPQVDRIFTSLSCPAIVSLDVDGPLVTTFRIALGFPVPAHSDSRGRSEELVTIPITTWVTLRKGSQCVDLRTRLENTARDHRLRVLFPTHIPAAAMWADRPFDVMSRPIAREDTSDWWEWARHTHPQLSFVDVSDGSNGFAFIGDGLPEAEVFDDETRTIAMTLLRGIRAVGMGFGFPPATHEGIQCLGRQEYRYALYPHEGDWEKASVAAVAHAYTTPLRAMQSGRHEGSLPGCLGFWRIEPSKLVFSGVKRAERRNSILLRFFNPTERTVRGKVTFYWPLRAAYRVDLEEKRREPLAVSEDHVVAVVVPSKKIFSLEVVTQRT